MFAGMRPQTAQPLRYHGTNEDEQRIRRQSSMQLPRIRQPRPQDYKFSINIPYDDPTVEES